MVFKKSSQDKELIKDKIDLQLTIDIEAINDELMNQPLLMKHYSKLKSEINYEVKLLKARVEYREAEIRRKLKDQKLRVADIDAEVALDASIVKLRSELMEAERVSDEYDGIMRALYQKHEVIKELCANLRKELQ